MGFITKFEGSLYGAIIAICAMFCAAISSGCAELEQEIDFASDADSDSSFVAVDSGEDDWESEPEEMHCWASSWGCVQPNPDTEYHDLYQSVVTENMTTDERKCVENGGILMDTQECRCCLVGEGPGLQIDRPFRAEPYHHIADGTNRFETHDFSLLERIEREDPTQCAYYYVVPLLKQKANWDECFETPYDDACFDRDQCYNDALNCYLGYCPYPTEAEPGFSYGLQKCDYEREACLLALEER